MRSDYALYTIAIIFFILTGIALAYQDLQSQQLWAVATVVLGLLFIGLGYSQRPKTTTTETSLVPTTPSPITKETEPIMETTPAIVELTKVKGIGKKRQKQLKAIGIDNVQELISYSAEDLAARLDISSKLTGRWIENAKKLAEEY